MQFTLRDAVPNAFIRVNPLGMQITNFRVDQAFDQCRRCWGLSYESQSWSYKAPGFLAFLGPLAHVTLERRKQRREAARARCAERRRATIRFGPCTL